MMNFCLIADRHGGFFLDPFEHYCGEEDAVGGQSRIKKQKAPELLLEEDKIIRF